MMPFFVSHSDNIVSLDIYFKDMSYDEFQQTPQFSDWTLIGKTKSIGITRTHQKC